MKILVEQFESQAAQGLCFFVILINKNPVKKV
jgi:hypothetical protein